MDSNPRSPRADALAIFEAGLAAANARFGFKLYAELSRQSAEKNLFDGDTESINRFPLIIFEPHDWLMPGQLTSQEFFRFHATSGREFCMKHENVASIVPHSSLLTMAAGLEN